jgi:uncharacterized protein DUF3592
MFASPRSARLVSRSGIVPLVIGTAVLLGGSLWLDHRGTSVIATVTRKHEELAVHDSPRGEWSRDYRVGVEFAHPGGGVGSSSVRVSRARFDSLQTGDHVSIRYIPALPQYARVADRSTPQVLRDAVSVFLDDSFLTPLMAWLVLGGTVLWILAHVGNVVVFLAGAIWIFGGWFLLFPAPGPVRLGAAETTAIVEDVKLVTKSPSGRYVRTHGGTGSVDLGFRNLAGPYQIVRFRLAVPGWPEPVLGVDAVDSASIPDLGVGATLPVRYDPRNPRDARLLAGIRTFRERNRYHLHWPVVGTGVFVVFAAALHSSRRRQRGSPRM